MSEEINHEEAYLLASSKCHESNLARCYLSLKERHDELQVLVKISVEACEMMVSDAYSMSEAMEAIHLVIAKAKGE